MPVLDCTERTAEVVEAEIQALPRALIERIRPPPRPCYAGRAKPSRAATSTAINRNQWLITELSQIDTGHCITWADGHDKFSFVISLDRKTLSPPLHFVKVMATDHGRKTVTWGYYQPLKKNMTNVEKKYITKRKAAASGAFRFVTGVLQACKFDPNNIILGWDLDAGDKQNVIPALQYERCQQQIQCIQALRAQEPSGSTADNIQIDECSDSDEEMED